MPCAKIEPSGCEVWHGGLVKIRTDLFLTPGDKRYDALIFYQPDWDSKEAKAGYPSLVDKDGVALDPEAYRAWVDKLPHIWLAERQFHSHILRFEPNVSQGAVLEAINHHIPNFYAAWCNEYDKLQGGMRKGWDVATRPKAVGRPRRYDREMNPTELAVRRLECQSKLDLIVAANLSIQSNKLGETFPSTEIDIGSDPIERNSEKIYGYTHIDISNPANDTGSLDTWEAYAAYASIGGMKVGTFYGASTDYTSRGVEVWGDVAIGDKRTLTGADTDVETGDFAGAYFSSGYIFRSTSGCSGLYSKTGDQFGTGEQTYGLGSYDGISLYGTGETLGLIEKAVSSTLVLSDVYNKTPSKVFAEVLALADVFTKLPSKIFSEILSLSDSVTGLKIIWTAVTDTINLADSYLKSVTKIFSETLTLSDSYLKQVAKIFSDSITLGDSFVKWVYKIFTETLSLIDSAPKLITKLFSDTLSLSDCIWRWRWLKPLRCLLPSVRELEAQRNLEKIDDGLTGV